MPEREAKSHHFNNGKAVQSTNHQQSAWLTHWGGTRMESSTQDHLSQFNRNDHKGVETSSDNFGSSKGITDVDLAISLKKPGTQSFPFFKRGQECVRNPISNEKPPQLPNKKTTTAFNLVETSSREHHHFQPEIASRIPTEEVKYHMFFGESGYSCSKPSTNEKFIGSTSHINTTHGPENFRHLSTLNNFQNHEKSEIPSFLTQKTTDPSTSSKSFIEDQYKRMQKHIGMGFFPHQTSSSQEITKSGTLHHHSFQNVPHFVHDVEITGGIHSFSRTTHSLLITKQTDVKVYQEKQIFRESRVSTQLKGDTLRELNCGPRHFDHGQQGVKIQLLDSDHDSQENIAKDFPKNESSADTDAMDIESFKENNRLSGLRLSARNKEIMVESRLPLLPPTTLEKETHKKRKIEIPDMNIEISGTNSTEKSEPCTSRTQSLDMNTLQFNVDQTSKSKSDECSDNNIGSRWIKRLKLNPTTQDTKSHENPKNLFALMNKNNEKEQEQTVSLSGKGEEESSSVETTKRECNSSSSNKDIITLSHSWIQRWSHNQSQSHSKKNVEESSSKVEKDNKEGNNEEFEKKQFPSIAAMALMGKAMTGYQQCKFKKKEAFVIWNTKTFE